MDPLIKKEVRLLLPAWIAAMLLAILPPVCVLVAWIVKSPQNDYSELQPYFFLQESIVPIVFALGVLLLGISSFGQELNFGSFGALLSQPAERRQIWSVKVVTLAVAFITVWLTAVLLVSGSFQIWRWSEGVPVHFFHPVNWNIDLESCKFQALENLTLFALVTFSGGLWTTLLLRQTTGAFWFTLLTPAAIVMGMSIVLQDWMQSWNINSGRFVVVALVLYSIAGFLWARRMFLLAQDVQWTGGEISLPWRGNISDTKITPVSPRPRYWLAALGLKEIQLHEASLAIAAVLLVLHLGCIAIRKIHPHFEGPDLQFIAESFWILWLLMPLLIGATAIAEERRIGILDSQLCGPVSRRAQFFVKFFSALLLSLLLGGAMPWLIEGRNVLNGGWLFPSAAASGTFIAAAGIFLIAFYASSLTRTTLQAMGYAMFFAVVIGLYEATWPSLFRFRGLWLLQHHLSIPIYVLVLIGLASWNFKWLHQNRRLWQRNILALVVAGVFIPVLASAIYSRPWEIVLPSEPRGPIRINNPGRLKFVANFNAVYALLPDGRLWADTFTYMPAFNANRAEFIGGSDWVDLAVGYTQVLGIRSDGTLWNIQRRGKSWFRATQIGSDRDWSQAANNFQGFLLLKRDGTLWALGFNQNNVRVRANPKGRRPGAISPPLVSTNAVAKNPGKPAPQLPVRISDDADWTSLYSTHLVAYARKNDGVNWVWRGFTTNHVSILAQETNVDNQWSEMNFSGSGFSHLEIKADGELWYYEGLGKNGARFQLGHGMTWKTAAFGMMWDIMAIRSDGTLWEFPINPALGPPGGESPWQVGHRSDWVALVLGSPPASGLPLASDGSIWDWTPRSSHAWLAPSRRPFCVGNIFQLNGAGK